MNCFKIKRWMIVWGTLLLGSGTAVQAQDADLQQRADELSRIPTQEILQAARERKGDFQDRLEPAGPEEILVYSPAPRKTDEPSGQFVLNVSSLVPLLEIRINEKAIRLEPGTYRSTVELPYRLEPGENLFQVSINSEAGVLENAYEIFLETETIKYQDPAKARKSKFTLINIAGVTRDDNVNGTPSDPEAATKNTLTIVGVGEIATGYSSALILTGIYSTENQLDAQYRSRDLLFRQFGVDWNETAWMLGDLTLGGGYNEIGLEGMNETFTSFKLKVPLEELKWTSSLRYGLKKSPGVDDPTRVSELGQKLDFKYLELPWNWSAAYTSTDTPLDSTDSTAFKTALKVSLPMEPLKYGLKLVYTNSQNKAADATSGIQEKSAKTAATFSIDYPLHGTATLNFSHKYEMKQTNVTGSDYRKNVDTLNLTWTY